MTQFKNGTRENAIVVAAFPLRQVIMVGPSLSRHVTAIKCYACETPHDPRLLLSVCIACGMPLRVDYDLSSVRLRLASLRQRPPSLWRYRELLPLGEAEEVSLVEGFTPLLQVESNVWIKDEGRNPTHSLEARGMSVAVSMAKHLGVRELSVPSWGNAASALAAYGSRGGLSVTVAIPEDALEVFGRECEFYGAIVHRVKGMIDHAARFLQEHGPKALDVAALHEPYRVEGQKTIAYELVEQMEGEVPDVIVCAAGEGTALIGMWKAFDEMERLGWIASGRRPRFVAVQAAGCPLAAKAFHEDPERAGSSDRELRVPAPAFGEFIGLRVLRETNGAEIAITDTEKEMAAQTLASCTGIDVCLEGGAAWAALMKLREDGFVRERDNVVVVNTATGLKCR